MFKSVSFLTTLICIAMCMSACSEDELPRSTVEFDFDQHDGGGQLFLTESNGSLSSFHPTLQNGAAGVEYEIKVLLDKPVAETTVIRFSTAGLATRSEPLEVGDYEIEPQGNLLTINKGENAASLLVRVFEDYEFEYFELNNIGYLVEAFTITLDEVVRGPGKIGKYKSFSVFILEDDPFVTLSWDPQDEPGADPGDVDMNLYLWQDGTQIASSITPGVAYEALSFPAGLPDGRYGFSYTYHAGSSNNLRFYVEVVNPGGNIDGFPDPKLFSATYTLANKRDSGFQPIIAQTMDKIGLNYFNLSGIRAGATGSRVVHERIWMKGSTGKSKFPITGIETKLLKDVLRNQSGQKIISVP